MRCTFTPWVQELTRPRFSMFIRSDIKISEIIDPNGNLFKQRILSRDESGSMAFCFPLQLSNLEPFTFVVFLTFSTGFTQKTIKRLFPCDDSMVVVMDDRGDVWQWSPNLIKVKPCKPPCHRINFNSY